MPPPTRDAQEAQRESTRKDEKIKSLEEQLAELRNVVAAYEAEKRREVELKHGFVGGEGEVEREMERITVSSETKELDELPQSIEEKEMERRVTPENQRLQLETDTTEEERWIIERSQLGQENQELKEWLRQAEEKAKESEQNLTFAESSLSLVNANFKANSDRLLQEIQQLRDSFKDRLESGKKMYDEALKNINVPSDMEEVDQYILAVDGSLKRARAETNDYAERLATVEASIPMKDLTIGMLEADVRGLKLALHIEQTTSRL